MVEIKFFYYVTKRCLVERKLVSNDGQEWGPLISLYLKCLKLFPGPKLLVQIEMKDFAKWREEVNCAERLMIKLGLHN